MNAARMLGAREVRRSPSMRGSSFAIQDVDALREDGEVVELVAKDLSPTRMLGTARLVRPGFLLVPRREVELYRQVLDPEIHGTPRFYGAKRTWGGWVLVLERVDGSPLEETSWGDEWHAAARWLANFHGTHARRRVSCESRLARYDHAYFAIWPDRAERFAKSRGMSRMDQANIRALARRYGPVASALADLPTTLIHGDFHASNVLVSTKGGTKRVCVLDWEMAGRGPALLDLAALTAGTWTRIERQEMARSYCDALSALTEACALNQPSNDFDRALELCSLHLAMQWLGWARNWDPEPRRAVDWARVATDCASRLGI